MLKIQTEYRHANPLKLVISVTEPNGNKLVKGQRVLLSDTMSEDVLGMVVKSYRSPRKRHLVWIEWNE